MNIKEEVINSFIQECHKTSIEKGFYDNVNPNDERFIGTQIALMHSELSEALEEVRDGNIGIYYSVNKTFSKGPTEHENMKVKPEGLAVELADCVIRIFDLCGALNIDLYRALEEKMDYNNHREYKHGRGNF